MHSIVFTNRKSFFLSIIFSVFFVSIGISQVAIGASTVTDGTMLDVISTNKGVLFPSVELSDTDTQAPIVGTLTSGTLIYNTASSGTGTTEVSPGHYYWASGKWKRMSVDGYSIHFEQTATTVASNSSTYRTLAGLSQSIAIPFTGTYQIVVVVNYNGRFPGSGNTGGIDAALATVKLDQDGTKIAESTVSSISPNSLQSLTKTVTIVRNVELVVGTTYNFRVQGREWLHSTGYGFGGEFGGPSELYMGANGESGGVPAPTDALFSTMTITLINSK